MRYFQETSVSLLELHVSISMFTMKACQKITQPIPALSSYSPPFIHISQGSEIQSDSECLISGSQIYKNVHQKGLWSKDG